MSDPMLPKGLQQVLASIVDRTLAGRITRVGLAAARCIDQLQAINLVSLEPKSAEEGSADLWLWEQMAPAVADTVATISGLCGVIDVEFPEASSRPGLYSTESSDERAEAELVFRAVGSLLKGGLAQVRDMVRQPELMASPWALLEELQRLRAHFRRRIGDAVYLSAAATAPVRREDVVPFASQEVQRALLYRSTAAELVKKVRARLEEPDESPKTLISALTADFDLFTAMPAWRHVHAGPKRRLLMVKALFLREGLDRASISSAVESLLEVLEDVSKELTRDLASHDLQVFADASFRLEQARLHVALSTGAAGWALETALSLVERLRGRDANVDALLRRLKKDELGEANGEELGRVIDELRLALSRIEV
jgi:hypothetical protein